MLSIKLISKIPAKKIKRAHLFLSDNFPALNKRNPITRLSKPHRTFTVGDDSPLPGGLAKGVGKASLEMPCTK